MENLERLTKVLRYAGLNLTPQMLQVVLDKNVRDLIDKLNAKLIENANLALDDIDEIIVQIQQAASKQAEAEAIKAAAKENKSAKKSTLEKA